MTTPWHTFDSEDDMRGACETVRRNYPHASFELQDCDGIPLEFNPATLEEADWGWHARVRVTIRRVGTPQRRGRSPIDEGAERWVDGLLTGWRIAAEGS